MNAIAADVLHRDLSQRRREQVLQVRLTMISFNLNSYLTVV
jgi:superfamily II DNA/RNA helicase